MRINITAQMADDILYGLDKGLSMIQDDMIKMKAYIDNGGIAKEKVADVNDAIDYLKQRRTNIIYAHAYISGMKGGYDE